MPAGPSSATAPLPWLFVSVLPWTAMKSHCPSGGCVPAVKNTRNALVSALVHPSITSLSGVAPGWNESMLMNCETGKALLGVTLPTRR